MSGEAADVTIVNVDAPEPADPPGSDAPADPWPVLLEHGERLTASEAAITALAAAVDVLAGQVQQTELTAEIAADHADAAIEIAADTADEIEQVAEEAAEADAAIAEEADAMTAEVAEEISEVAPKRDHPWFAPRSMFKRGD